MLDRQRSVYFARSRALDQTSQMAPVVRHKFKDRFYFDEHWQNAANLDQQQFNGIVLHNYLTDFKSHVADLRWVQVIYDFEMPEDAVAIKSFVLKIGGYRSIISLNITKQHYQTSYIISNRLELVGQSQKDGGGEIYVEKYYEKDEEQE